jgi:hypothetical protein
MAALKYQVIDTRTGRDASESWGGCSYVVTPDGKVAWWDDSQGWEEDQDQARYEVRLLDVDAAVAAERERCAKIAEGHDGIYTDGAPVAIAEAIRAG